MVICILADIAACSSSTIEEKLAEYNDSLFYIYTSGTTGLPKAAIITHSRYLFASYCLFCMGLAWEEDVLYSGTCKQRWSCKSIVPQLFPCTTLLVQPSAWEMFLQRVSALLLGGLT